MISFKQIRMGSDSDENDLIAFNLVEEKKIAADMAFAMIRPLTFERMIEPFGTQRCIIGDEHQHDLFEAGHVMATGA